MGEAPRLVITCEHGGNRVPQPFRGLFDSRRDVLESHRGYDPGALELSRRLARELAAPLVASQVTRLLVDLNRSIGHPRLFSEWSRALGRREREAVLDRFYRPHRRKVEEEIRRGLASGRRVLHLAVHTFTPELDGVVRRADAGFLYDPARPAEAAFCLRWRDALRCLEPRLRLRRNYPYRGAADGLSTELRRRFDPQAYLGVEIEVNQLFPLHDPARWAGLQGALLASLRSTLEAPVTPPRP